MALKLVQFAVSRQITEVSTFLMQFYLRSNEMAIVIGNGISINMNLIFMNMCLWYYCTLDFDVNTKIDILFLIPLCRSDESCGRRPTCLALATM